MSLLDTNTHSFRIEHMKRNIISSVRLLTVSKTGGDFARV
jgi:hypothetical protein